MTKHLLDTCGTPQPDFVTWAIATHARPSQESGFLLFFFSHMHTSGIFHSPRPSLVHIVCTLFSAFLTRPLITPPLVYPGCHGCRDAEKVCTRTFDETAAAYVAFSDAVHEFTGQVDRNAQAEVRDAVFSESAP